MVHAAPLAKGAAYRTDTIPASVVPVPAAAGVRSRRIGGVAGFGSAAATLAAGLAATALVAGLAAAAQPALESLPAEARAPIIEQATVVKAPRPGPHTVYVLDIDFFTVANRVYVVDADRLQVVGMLDAGWLPNVLLSPDNRSIYLVETYYSRLARGERTDVVTVYDSEDLYPAKEIQLPEGRMLVVPKIHTADLTPDGRYLLSFNMTPATSVTVVDLLQGRFVQQIETPGCFYVFPSAPNRFFMHCSDGSLLGVTLDGMGHATTRRTRPFHPSDDYIFDNRAFVDGRLYAISYEGNVYPIDLTGPEPVVEPAWSLLGEEDRAQSWRPGGWQISAFHAPTGRLYVLMHQGPQWTHKASGTEVWVYDVTARRRVDRLVLARPADSLAVSQDARPQLYALSILESSLQVYDATTGRYLGLLEHLGASPYVLKVAR